MAVVLNGSGALLPLRFRLHTCLNLWVGPEPKTFKLDGALQCNFVDGSQASTSRSFVSEAKHDSCTDAEDVLVVVAAVVDGGEQVVGLDEPDGEMAAGIEIEASAEVRGEGRAGIS